MSTPTHSPVRTPDDIPHQPLSDLVEHWSSARLRTTLVAHVDGGTPTADDLFAELSYGTRIAQEATSGRWCVVADLLRTRNAPSWPEIGRDGDDRPRSQDRLPRVARPSDAPAQHHRHPLGLINAEATALHLLSEEVSW